jgi:hypothetical protein
LVFSGPGFEGQKNKFHLRIFLLRFFQEFLIFWFSVKKVVGAGNQNLGGEFTGFPQAGLQKAVIMGTEIDNAANLSSFC